MKDLRCGNGIKHGELGDEFVEVTCRSARCGRAPGVVVIHRFSTATGELISTRLFRDINTRSKKGQDHESPLRSA